MTSNRPASRAREISGAMARTTSGCRLGHASARFHHLHAGCAWKARPRPAQHRGSRTHSRRAPSSPCHRPLRPLASMANFPYKGHGMRPRDCRAPVLTSAAWAAIHPSILLHLHLPWAHYHSTSPGWRTRRHPLRRLHLCPWLLRRSQPLFTGVHHRLRTSRSTSSRSA